MYFISFPKFDTASRRSKKRYPGYGEEDDSAQLGNPGTQNLGIDIHVI